jgi:hypothetical protein
MKPRTEPPANRTHLLNLLSEFSADEESAVALANSMATIVACQMLPTTLVPEGFAGMVKGGTAMKLRLGRTNARFSADLDFVRSIEQAEFEGRFQESLRIGWQGFTGVLITQAAPNPAGIPKNYIMQPYRIALAYKGKPWKSVTFELGADEIGGSAEYDLKLSSQLVADLRRFGFSDIKPIPVIPIHHQIAQKIHASTAEGSERAHDLVDLQLLIDNEEIDMQLIRDTCERLFRYRRNQGWPPTFIKNEGWDELYRAAREDLPVLESVDEAVSWGNRLIGQIEASPAR